jgi:hypothetical protein
MNITQITGNERVWNRFLHTAMYIDWLRCVYLVDAYSLMVIRD